tara:strand:+ start:257 stop:697 length:441 start_codon:yes stop_codon:yes gene_type:complete
MRITRGNLRKIIKEALEYRRKPQRTPHEEEIIQMAKQMNPQEDYDWDYHDFEEARKAIADFKAGKEMPEITHPSYYRAYKREVELAAMEKQMRRELDRQIANFTPEEIARAEANLSKKWAVVKKRKTRRKNESKPPKVASAHPPRV